MNLGLSLGLGGGSAPAAASTQDQLITALAGAGISEAYALSTATVPAGVWTCTGLANGLTMTQATGSAQPAVSGTGATFDAGDVVSHTINAETLTAVFAFTKSDASTDGNMLTDQGGAGIGRYTSGGGSALSGTWTVNGASVTSSGTLYTALHTTGKRLVKVVAPVTTGDTAFRFGRVGIGMVGTLARAVILDHTALGGGLAAAVALAEAWVME